MISRLLAHARALVWLRKRTLGAIKSIVFALLFSLLEPAVRIIDECAGISKHRCMG